MSLNPYAAPPLLEARHPAEAGQSLRPFIAWERMRIWYNAILVVVVVASSLPFPRCGSATGC